MTVWLWFWFGYFIIMLHVWNFIWSVFLHPSTLHFVFCKALCTELSVSAIQFTSHLFLAHARRRLSMGTDVCQRSVSKCVLIQNWESVQMVITCSEYLHEVIFDQSIATLHFYPIYWLTWLHILKKCWWTTSPDVSKLCLLSNRTRSETVFNQHNIMV